MEILVNYVRKMQHKNNDERIALNNNRYQVETHTDIPYIHDGNAFHLLDVYGPGNTEKALPVIVEVHGGAYVSCTKEFNRQHGQYIASKGFRVVNMNYTLYPEGDMRTSVPEIFQVLDWVYKNREEYGFDCNNVFLTGDSAGGHLVMVCASVQTSPEAQAYFGVKPFACGIRGYAVSCPVADSQPYLHPFNQASRLMHVMLRKMLRNKELLKHTSYRYFAKDPYPEIMILTTPTDSLLYPVTRSMHEDLQNHGIRHIYKE